MQKKIDQMFVDYIFNCLKANHPNHGYMFKGDDASDVADAWKDIFYQRLQEKNITDAELITKKAYSFRSIDKPFPDVDDFILYLMDIPMPSNGWLRSCVLQILHNEKSNRTSPIKVTHRNNSAPIEHFEIAEKIARRIPENCWSVENNLVFEQMLETAKHDSLIRYDDSQPKQELSFSDVKKLANMTPDVRDQSLQDMLKKLGKK
jgi:hypothetical protein